MIRINGIEWYIVFVDADNSVLMRPDGTKTVGMTDNDTKCVYLSNALYGAFLKRVLTHEIAHCVCFSYNLGYDRQTEEYIADFIAYYGAEVISKTEEAIKSGLHNIENIV